MAEPLRGAKALRVAYTQDMYFQHDEFFTKMGHPTSADSPCYSVPAWIVLIGAQPHRTLPTTSGQDSPFFRCGHPDGAPLATAYIPWSNVKVSSSRAAEWGVVASLGRVAV